MAGGSNISICKKKSSMLITSFNLSGMLQHCKQLNKICNTSNCNRIAVRATSCVYIMINTAKERICNTVWFIWKSTHWGLMVMVASKCLSTLAQMITCHLISTKPLCESILILNFNGVYRGDVYIAREMHLMCTNRSRKKHAHLLLFFS